MSDYDFKTETLEYCERGASIYATLNNGDRVKILDIRSHGYLTGGAAQGLSHDAAVKIQDAWAARIMKALRIADRLERGDVSGEMMDAWDKIASEIIHIALPSTVAKFTYKAMTKELMKEVEGV